MLHLWRARKPRLRTRRAPVSSLPQPAGETCEEASGRSLGRLNDLEIREQARDARLTSWCSRQLQRAAEVVGAPDSEHHLYAARCRRLTRTRVVRSKWIGERGKPRV